MIDVETIAGRLDNEEACPWVDIRTVGGFDRANVKADCRKHWLNQLESSEAACVPELLWEYVQYSLIEARMGLGTLPSPTEIIDAALYIMVDLGCFVSAALIPCDRDLFRGHEDQILMMFQREFESNDDPFVHDFLVSAVRHYFWVGPEFPGGIDEIAQRVSHESLAFLRSMAEEPFLTLDDHGRGFDPDA